MSIFVWLGAVFGVFVRLVPLHRRIDNIMLPQEQQPVPLVQLPLEQAKLGENLIHCLPPSVPTERPLALRALLTVLLFVPLAPLVPRPDSFQRFQKLLQPIVGQLVLLVQLILQIGLD